MKSAERSNPLPKLQAPPLDPPSRLRRWGEFLALYGLLPSVPLTDLPPGTKVICLATGVLFVAMQLVRDRRNLSFSWRVERDPRFAAMVGLFFCFLAVTILGVHLLRPEYLLVAPRETPILWGKFVLLYCAVSVFPQELFYRVLFQHRYSQLFDVHTSPFVGGAAFAWGHAFIGSPITYWVTFGGGVIFHFAFLRTGSVTTVALYHAACGIWLYTVGLGDRFAFPMPPV